MLTIKDLIAVDQVTLLNKITIKGKWCEIRLSPDLIGGELLNIGVCFVDTKKVLHFKLLESAQPFSCLYGKDSLEQFQHLLNATGESLKKYGLNCQFGNHISLGNLRYYEGSSIESIIEKLYTSVVSLGRARSLNSSELAQKPHKSLYTPDLRRNILRRFKDRHSKQFRQFWKEEPTTVKIDNTFHELDMQIWSADDLHRPTCFGTIISVDYADPFYRKAFLNTAYRDLTIARDYLSEKAQGGLFILRPSFSSKNESLLNTIDNEIDATTWALINKYKIKAEVTESAELIENAALAFVN